MLLSEWAKVGGWMTVLVVVVFMGALSAIMSTADSILLSLGSLISEDLLGRPGNDPETTVLGKRAAAAVMVVAVMLALFPRLTLWRLIELKMSLLIQCVPAFLLAIHWPGLRARPVLAGLVAGTVTAVASELAGVARVGGVHVGVVGLAVNVMVVVGAASLEGAAARLPGTPGLDRSAR
jgi:Na+/proline symporter